MQFVFHTRGESLEPAHIHVYRGKGPKRDRAKIWLADLSLAKGRGFRLSELNEMLKYLKPLQETLIKDYDENIATIGG